MLRALKEVRADDSVVGFYQSTTMGAFFNQTLVDNQAIHQVKLRHGGIVVVHGAMFFFPVQKRGPTIFAPLQMYLNVIEEMLLSVHSNFQKNFSRLTARPHSVPSREFSYFLSLFLTQYTHSMMSHKLTFTSIMQEVPLKIKTNPLSGAFISTISERRPTSLSQPLPSDVYNMTLSPLYSTLHLGNPTLTKNLEHVVEAIDNYKTEEGNLAYHVRQIAREKARAEAYVSKKREETANRVAQGLAPLPEEDVSRLFKIPAEPSRLESMLLLGQVDAYAKTLEGTSGLSLVKMYAARAGTDGNREVFQ